MAASADPATLPLLILNLVMGAACLAAVLAVATAAILDIRERRRFRALVPPCWPPPGCDDEGLPLARHGHRVATREGAKR